MSVLLAVQNADVLRRLDQPEPDLTAAALARSLGRDKSNLGKTLSLLREEKLVAGDSLALTDAGRQLLPRLDVLEGVTTVPDGFLALGHNKLASHPLNPRRSFDPDALDELRQDILQSGGITSSLLVRPIGDSDPEFRFARTLSAKYWIVAGERRWRAVGLAIDEGDLPFSYRLPCQVREMSDAEHLRLSIGENIQRVDLDHVELGQQFEALLLTGEDTPQTIAERLSKTPEYVQQHVRILRMDDDSLAALKSGEMTFKTALGMVAKPKAKAEPGHREPDMFESHSGGRNGVEDSPPSADAAGSGHVPQGESPAAGNVAEPQMSSDRTSHDTPPAGTRPPLQEPARAAFDPSPKMRLILLEIAHKVGRDETAKFREGYTPIAEVPAGGAASELVHARAIGFRSIQGKDEVRIDPRGPGREWLDRVGWDRDDAQGHKFRMGDAAIDAGLASEKARAAYDGTAYISAWLNVAAPATVEAPDLRIAPPGTKPAQSTRIGSPPSDVVKVDAEEDEVMLASAQALSDAWTGTAYRFPATSPSLPKEEDFRAALERIGVSLPLTVGDGGAIFDGGGRCVLLTDDDHFPDRRADAFAHLIRIALHVCSGEAAQKALS